MQVETYNKTQIKELLTDAKDVAIMPSLKAGADSFTAAAGLFYMLKQKYEDTKHIHFVFSGEIPKPCEKLISKNDMNSDLTHRDVLISIDYSNTPAAKVSYTTDDDILTLKLGPVNKDFDRRRIKTKIIGFNYDLILAIGARDLEDLGTIYHHLKDEIYDSKIINIGNTKDNKRYGIVNVLDTSSENLSTLIFKKAAEWDLVPNEKSAKCLLTGMTYRSGEYMLE